VIRLSSVFAPHLVKDTDQIGDRPDR